MKKMTTLLAAVMLCTGALAQEEPTPTETVKPAEQKAKDDSFKKATKYFFQKKFQMAELLLQEEIKKNPENHLAYSYLGDIFLSEKRYEASIELYQRALDLNPNSADNYFRLGQAYYFKNLGKVAIKNFEKAYSIDPKLKFAYYHVGLAYLMIERDKGETIRNWEKYLELAPEDPQYEKIRRAVELLKDPNFKIPEVGSDIPIEEALHLGGSVLEKTESREEDRSAGHEEKKTDKKQQDIYRDDDL